VKPLQVFIGYDQKETVAYHVLSHSILRHASVPVSITPVMRSQIEQTYRRPRGPLESTDFSLSRFLVPYLSGYEGHSLFLDCDMLCQSDIGELFFYGLAYPKKAVQVVQHDYVPKSDRKFLNQVQTPYRCKNWSSVMLFNNALCRQLTPEYVNTATGLDLHQFKWTFEDQIGALPLQWNWLVGEYDQNEKAKLLHYTLGTPCFEGYATCDHANLWHAEYDLMSAPYANLRVSL
jgi:lipopolysaccharide biosynthesis glycosyltransferase